MIAPYSVCLALLCLLTDQLYPTAAANCRYRVIVKTGRGVNDGTNARVFIQLTGSAATCPERELKSSNGFKPKSTKRFVITCPCLGQQRRLVIGHKHSNEMWLLSSVSVQKHPNNLLHKYPYNNWLGVKSGERRNTVRLYNSYCKYHVSTLTGNDVNAGTRAQVFLKLEGSEARSGWIRLYNRGKTQFTPGKTDHFTFSALCIGYQRKMAIRRDNTGSSPDWYLEELRVRSVVRRGRRADMVYVVNRWVPSRGAVYQYNTYTSYKVIVYTGDQSDAGTNAKVKISLRRRLKYTRAIALDHENASEFGRGMVDTFDVKGKGLGNVDKIFVRHDGSGSSPGWYIKKIYVLNRSSNEMYECPCNKWLQSSAPYAWFSCYQSA